MPSDSERWVQVSVLAHPDAADDLTRILSLNCPGGAAVEESADPPPGLPPRLTVKGWIPAADQETRHKLEIALLLLSRDGAISEPIFQELAYEDWATSWKEHFRPLRIGRRTVIVPSWCSYEPEPDDLVITLDPGMAFGTGLHATTRLCLQALEAHPPSGQRILDVGCGSGILSIAAVLLGAASATAIDNDPVAVTASRENAERNAVADRMQVAWGTLPSGTAGKTPLHNETDYDLVVANILAEVIIGMAGGLSRSARMGGTLVLSGILAEKADLVRQAMTAEGVDIHTTLAEGEWVALIGQRH